MPFKFDIDTTVGVIRETWTGCVDLMELKDSCLPERTHKDYVLRMAMIFDFRQGTASIDAKDIMQFALWFGDKDPPARHASSYREKPVLGSQRCSR